MTEENALQVQLETYKKDGANLLMPSTHIAGLSEFHQPVIETVQLSTNPEDGDVYPHDTASTGDKKKWRPTKQALMKLSVCAGVIWSPTASRRIDNQSDRNYIAYKAVGGIKKADGQPVFFSAEYDMDFEVIQEELKETYQKKAANMKDKNDKQKAEYVDYCVNRDMLQKRKFKLRLCEAGAMNRVLRMLLGIKQAYTTEELKKPFVMARIVFRPDFNDKEVKKALTDAYVKAARGIYGPDSVTSEIKNSEPIDVTPIEEPPADPSETPEERERASRHTKLEPQDMGSKEADPVEIFKRCGAELQGQQIETLAKQKGYDLVGYLTRAKKLSSANLTDEKRVQLYAYLLTMPDKDGKPGIEADDDVPFD